MGGVIVVDAGRSRSTCLGRDAYIHDQCHKSVIIICFSTNCPVVICLPTVCYVFEREASSENYGPRVYFIIYKKILKIPCCNLFTSILCCTSSYLLYPSLSDLILASNREGIDNSFYRAGCKYLFVCVGAIIGDLCVPTTILIPWFLTEGNMYLYFAASPFPLQGKNQRKLKK